MIVGALIGLIVMAAVILILHVAARSLDMGGFQPTGVTAIWFAFAMSVGAVIAA